MKQHLVGIGLVLLGIGCTATGVAKAVPQTCPQDPNFYHVYEVRHPDRPGTPSPTFVRHVRKDEWDRAHGIVPSRHGASTRGT